MIHMLLYMMCFTCFFAPALVDREESDTENPQMNMLTKHDINQCFKGMSQCLYKCKSLSLG